MTLHTNLRTWLYAHLPHRVQTWLSQRTRRVLPPRAWATVSLSLSIAALVVCMLLVYIVDPFQQYRIATFYQPDLKEDKQAYLNSGLAKNDAYDALILGSSMTENTPVALFNAIYGVDAAKLSFQGGLFETDRLMLEAAYDSGHDVKLVFMGIDHFAMNAAVGSTSMEIPAYFYSRWGIWDDAPYFFNRFVLGSYVTRALRSFARGERFDGVDYDRIYRFGDKEEYGREAVLRSVNFIYKEPGQREGDQETIDAHIDACLAPFIQAHPETTFLLMFEPYSVVEWYRLYAEGSINRVLFHKEYFARRMLTYENVRLYDPQSDADIITNLDNYMDTNHFGPWINELLIERMAQEQYRVTEIEQIIENNARIEALAQAFEP